MIPPTLGELCLQSAIDNLHRFGDVGDTDIDLLRKFLPHCTTDQLRHIENSSKGRDLSPVTDELWRKSYGRDFGESSLGLVESKLRNNRTKIKWRDLYEAKRKSREAKEKKGVEMYQQLCREANDKKQSRQIKMCSKLPPDPKRKFGGGSSHFSHVKGRLMKKARVEHAASGEARIRAAMKKNQHK